MTPAGSLNRLLDRLEEAKRHFGPGPGAGLEQLMAALERRCLPDADSLIRFHEALLFVRAYPPSAAAMRQAEKILSTFGRRVEKLRAAGTDLSAFDTPEASGIAGTLFSAHLSYEIVRSLARRHPRRTGIDWENYEVTDRLGGTWRRLFPLIEDDSLVEAHVPYLDWLRAAMGRSRASLGWLLERFERLPLPQKDKAELWDSLELPFRWELGNSHATRTRMRLPVRRIFYHDGPLLKRAEVSLAAELTSPPIPLARLSSSEGDSILNMARDTSAVRYRELYGFTWGDPRRVWLARIGRGIEAFLSGVPPESRLPLRAYHAAIMFKNGVPIGYFETLSLFERLEVGFNLYYTFREGETAWLLARLLRVFHQILGVTCYSIDPYQIGLDNEEAIESGAFWFYRKLGFRPVLPEVERLAEAEERKIRTNPAYRSPRPNLRRMSVGQMIYEMPVAQRGAWDRFHIRNLGLAVQRRMAERYHGDSDRIQNASVLAVSRALGVRPSSDAACKNLSAVLALVPGLARWTNEEKEAVARIIRAKTAPDESRYVRLLQQHPRLRGAMLRLGSKA